MGRTGQPGVQDRPGAVLPGEPQRVPPSPVALAASAGRRRLLAPSVVYGPVGLALFALATFVLALLALGATPIDAQADVAAWWPAAGLAVVAMLWAPRDRLWLVTVVVVVASGAANLVVGRHGPAALGFGLSNALEPLVVALLVRRHGPPRLASLEDLFRLLAATLVGALVMGVGAGLTVLLETGAGFLSTAGTVMTSHCAAILVVAPLAMRSAGARAPGRPPEAVVQWTSLLVVTVLTFAPGQELPLTFLPMPFLVWGAVRLGVRTVCAQLVLVAVVVTWSSRYGGGHMAVHTGADSTLTASLIQAYLLVCALVTVPLVVTVGQRRAALESVAASERLFRRGFSDALLGMVLLRRCRPGGDHPEVDDPGHHSGAGLDVVELNDVAARLLAELPTHGDPTDRDPAHGDPTDGDPAPGAALVGSSWTARLHPDDRSDVLARSAEMSAGTLDGWRGEISLTCALGARWIEVALSPLSASAGDDLFVAQMVDVTARRAAEERLTAQATQDSLTGLANRAFLLQRVDEAVAALPGDGSGIAVLFCDLDDFKDVNDSAGHSEGDRVLVDVARRIEAVLAPDDVAARLGGDEFIVLRPHAADSTEAEALAAELLAALAAPVVANGQPVVVGASIGIAWGAPGATADALLRDADAAMYAAKAEGKRRAVVFSDEHRARVARVAQTEGELRRALAGGELEMYMQPVVDLRDGRPVAAEALVRWNHPERGVVGPDHWLHVAESAGLMPELGTWVLRRSCELAAAWPEPPGRPAPAVHVNVSARQLEVPGFVEVVHEVLAETGLAPGRLVLEFTETQLDTISEALLHDLGRLRADGIALAADDFGTGYSPLTRITELPITMIKVDRGFVDAMLDDVRSQAIVTTLVRLSDSLGLELVAEGVETQEQAQALQMLGCTTAQGYLWSRPVPAAQFHDSLRTAVR
ncbi:EAL domain-containing protein [Actinotalea ferrariae]|uniref:bifunctional diguanylate cyclase/phosphodiesterase n=1 Tax=Actinotalea ferrariae TaxID=1386098 RepID=UPI001C8B3AC7|nr:EAL domain-containing protein [Actinotalea ferrariae]MBX9245445.1 EAL domain-containing protein [Actinotalea ferrariae]